MATSHLDSETPLFLQEFWNYAQGFISMVTHMVRQECKPGFLHVIVVHTNKSGAANLEQNPALRAINDMNRDALAYWRDLGLTPAGLKRINEDNLKGAGNKPTLGSVLREIGL